MTCPLVNLSYAPCFLLSSAIFTDIFGLGRRFPPEEAPALVRSRAEIATRHGEFTEIFYFVAQSS
jgi:hypothetical protein